MGERRERRMRGAGVLTAVVLAAMALGGCSLIDDGQQVWEIIQDEARQQEALSAALDELRDLDGVDQVASRFLPDGPHGDEADINVVATEGATPKQLIVIATIAGEALTGVQLRPAVTLFTVEIDHGGKLTQSTFALTEDQLAAEIAYWRAAEKTIGAPLSLKLVESDAEVPYRREFLPTENNDALRATEQFIANYDELLANSGTAEAETWWLLPGLMAFPDLPPVEVIDLLDRIRGSSPLIDYTVVNDKGVAPEGAAVWWQGEQQGVRVIVNAHELRASDWPMVLELARLAIAVPGASFSYQAADADQYDEYRFYTAACEGEVFVETNDRTLVEALAEGGTLLPAAGGPGFCQPPPPSP